MTDEQRRSALKKLGAADGDMDALLAYTADAFQPRANAGTDELSPKWEGIWNRALFYCKTPPRLEMFASVAGAIPIIYPASEDDFETLLREIVYKGKAMPDTTNMGAQFVFGKTVRFIILSGKPYSNVPASFFNLNESEWLEQSMIIRKHHECAHYYTKRFLGSSRNNLHDELIADFCGLYAAFGEYRAKWFMRFYDNRAALYTRGMSDSAADIVRAIAVAAAKGVEAWAGTAECAGLDEAGRIEYLAGKELLEFI
ncbi:MAG TPA: hypothetical protein DEB31_01475 [Clostridiales bacterium]|nr:hypothetical protein [Clostridiales bacterium]